jgi:hypothetical protein
MTGVPSDQAVFLAFALVIAACSSGGGGGGRTGSSGTTVKDGGTLSYAADQEPTGFNCNTSKDNGAARWSGRRRCRRMRSPFEPPAILPGNRRI